MAIKELEMNEQNWKKKHEYFVLSVVGEKTRKLEEIRLIKLVMWCASWWIGSLSSCLKHGK